MGSNIIPPNTRVFVNIGTNDAPKWSTFGTTSDEDEYEK